MPKRRTIGDDPQLRKEILNAGEEALSQENAGSGCKHPILKSSRPWPGSDRSSKGAFDIADCPQCGTTKGLRPYRWPDLADPKNPEPE